MARILINQKNLKIKRQFIKGLRYEYHVKKTPLWDCFLMYITFLDFLGCEYLTEMTPWQKADYKLAITGYKTMWHRTRRGGKSLGLTVLAVFFSIINFGYRANAGVVVWRCPLGKQIKQARYWFKRNPFVININKQDGEINIINSRGVDISAMTPGNVASLGGAVYIMDEAKKIWVGHKVYSEALESYGIFIEGPIEHTRMISASTGARLTLFHTQFLSNEWAYSMHTYKDCPWIPEEKIESERKGNPQDRYYVEQEYECIWVARGDTAYRNIYIVDMVNKSVTHGNEIFKFGDHPFFPDEWEFPKPTKAGVDFNGKKTGHYIVIGSIDDEAIYINKEEVVFTIAALKPFGAKYNMEVESGPFPINIENANRCTQQGVKCLHSDWTGGIEKAKRYKITTEKMIIIDRDGAPFTLSNFEEAITDENRVEEVLKKNTHQHGLDGALHMIHKGNYPIRYSPIHTNLDDDYIESGSNFYGNI